jgi:hypothetical protein
MGLGDRAASFTFLIRIVNPPTSRLCWPSTWRTSTTIVRAAHYVTQHHPTQPKPNPTQTQPTSRHSPPTPRPTRRTDPRICSGHMRWMPIRHPQGLSSTSPDFGAEILLWEPTISQSMVCCGFRMAHELHLFT